MNVGASMRSSRLTMVVAGGVLAALSGALLPTVATAAPSDRAAQVRSDQATIVSKAGAAKAVPAADKLGVIHADPIPKRLQGAPTDTESLYERAGLDLTTANAETPTGEPTVNGLTSHVPPSCTGTGTDGNRVQALYVREASTPSRYHDVLPIIRNEIATVDDVFSMSARKTGSDLKVRWVHDNCVPVVPEVVVPDGTFDTSLWRTAEALKAQGYNLPSRKYLAFTDAQVICGIASLYADDAPTANKNDGAYPTYARVDNICWSGSTSVPAHELTHMLGGVQKSAPHATASGHCTDEADVMCYVDAAGVTMTQVCASGDEQLLDCRGDDYFNPAPAEGSYLATHWNVAKSAFLDDETGRHTPPTLDLTASAITAETGDPVRIVAASDADQYTWSADAGCDLSTSGSEATMVCPAFEEGPVTVSATVTDDQGYRTERSVQVLVARAAPPTATVSAPSTIKPGASFEVAVEAMGKPTFDYAWSVPANCALNGAGSQVTVSCHRKVKSQVAVDVIVAQADGQTVPVSTIVQISRK